MLQVSQLRKVLTANAAALDNGDHRQYTAFHVACAGGHLGVVKALLDAGCDTTLRSVWHAWPVTSSWRVQQLTDSRFGQE